MLLHFSLFESSRINDEVWSVVDATMRTITQLCIAFAGIAVYWIYTFAVDAFMLGTNAVQMHVTPFAYIVTTLMAFILMIGTWGILIRAWS